MNEETVLILNEFTELKNKLSDLKGMRTKFKKLESRMVLFQPRKNESTILSLFGKGYVKSLFFSRGLQSFTRIKLIVDGEVILNVWGDADYIYNTEGGFILSDLEFSKSLEVKVIEEFSQGISGYASNGILYALFSLD